MGMYERDIENGMIPCLFAFVLYDQLRPNRKGGTYLSGDRKFPSRKRCISVNYHEPIAGSEADDFQSRNAGPLLFTLRFIPAWYIPGVESVDFVGVNSIEVSGPDITSEVVDKAIAEYHIKFKKTNVVSNPKTTQYIPQNYRENNQLFH